MESKGSDPRVFFAAERTLLAWLRSGLTLMALGFVVARFGLFVRLLAMQARALPAPAHPGASAVLGTAFVLCGSLAVVASTVQHARFVKSLPPADLPARYSRQFAVLLSTGVAILGLALALYLALASN